MTSWVGCPSRSRWQISCQTFLASFLACARWWCLCAMQAFPYTFLWVFTSDLCNMFVSSTYMQAYPLSSNYHMPKSHIMRLTMFMVSLADFMNNWNVYREKESIDTHVFCILLECAHCFLLVVMAVRVEATLHKQIAQRVELAMGSL